MKPQWSNAPEWANYLAQDEDSTWWWFALEPMKASNGWGPAMGRNKQAKFTNPDWDNTLEIRP